MALQLLITLREITPSVWRRMIVPDYYSFYQLHLAIQACFGWKDAHLFQFSKNDLMDEFCIGMPGEEGDEMEAIDARIKGVVSVLLRPGDRYSYIYDFGDNWEHNILLEEIKAERIDRPYCLDGANACPPEDVGGVGGYEYMLDVINNPEHPERQSYIEWLGLAEGEQWDSNRCDISEINKRL